MKGKKILSIETSSELCSAALYFDVDKYDERNIMLKHIHSERLVPVIEDLFSANNASPKDLDCISVSIGPGSFTGLRIGLTAAKAIAFAAGLPIVPVPTFDALALEISEFVNRNSSFCIINNANSEECYFGNYYLEEGEVNKRGEVILQMKNGIKEKISDDSLIFGNLKSVEGIRQPSSPRAVSIAKWTYLFGEDLLTYNFDYLEPNYLKNFKIGKRNEK